MCTATKIHSLLKGVFTVFEDFLVISLSIYYFHKGYTMMQQRIRALEKSRENNMRKKAHLIPSVINFIELSID